MENKVIIAAILLPVSYLVGSINFSILLFRMRGKGDPRHHFSGNAGVINVYRQAGVLWAAIILLLDLGRALVISGAALYQLPTTLVPWMGLALILGNRFPCFHKFRGGKGVATYLGFTAFISPQAAIFSALAWVGAYGIVRIPFIASFVMTIVLMAGTIVACGYRPSAMGGTIVTALFILYNHKRNILELINSRRVDKKGNRQVKNHE